MFRQHVNERHYELANLIAIESQLNRISFVGQELDNSSFLAQIHH
jgi:hypothetical protein